MKPIIKTFVILALVLAGSISYSCKDYLDISSYFDDELKLDTVFAQKRYIEAYMWDAARMFPEEAQVFRSPYTPGPYATDEAFTLAGTGEYSGMAFVLGEITSSNLSNFNRWGGYYRIIRKCNTIIARIDEASDWTNSERLLILGYTRFLRAYAYYSILVDFGPPILMGDELMGNNEAIEYYDRPRCLYDEAVEYICSEMEEAGKILPLKQPIMNFGRPTKGSAYGLIARLRLIHASPLYNGGPAARTYFGNWVRKTDGKHYVSQTPDEKRWAVAAAAAKRVMDMKDTGGGQLFKLFTVTADSNTPELPQNVTDDPDYYADFPVGAAGIDPYRSFSEMFDGEAVASINPEYVWGRPSGEIAEMGRRAFPIANDGWSELCVTQKVVDAFRMVDGRPIQSSSPEYPYSESGFTESITTFSGYRLNAGVFNMYVNREARFYASIGFSECFWPCSSTTTSGQHDLTVTYYYNSANGKGGSHNGGIYPATGYVSKKGIHPQDAWSGDNSRRMPKAFGIIRYAETLLSYAEALNNLTSTHTVELNEETYTLTRNPDEIRKAFNQVRHRAGLPGMNDAEASTQKTVQALIEQERMVEFMHENRRYYDVRRWGIYEATENEPVSGMNGEADKDSFYQRVIIGSVRVGGRVVDKKMNFLPIPKDEVRRLPSFDQNPGWDD